MPLSTVTAWQELVDYGKLKKRDKVLINGASGGTGTAAVQLAKALRAHVMGVCSGSNAQMVKSLGADEVVHYKTTGVTERFIKQDFDGYSYSWGPGIFWAKRHTLIKSSFNLVLIAPKDNVTDTPYHMLYAGACVVNKKTATFLQRGPGYHLFLTKADGVELEEGVKALEDAEADPTIDSVYEFTFHLQSQLLKRVQVDVANVHFTPPSTPTTPTPMHPSPKSKVPKPKPRVKAFSCLDPKQDSIIEEEDDGVDAMFLSSF
ncbi:NADPh quinone reductase [Mortierella sp. AD032]|nr:NADPh quinone reductase [Mortierella sp. AD032]